MIDLIELREILNDTANALSILQSLRSLFGNPGDSANFQTVFGKLNSLLLGQKTIEQAIALAITNIADVQTTLDNMTTGTGPGTPVNLPVTPPSGYGGGDWGAPIGPSGETATQIVNLAASWAYQSFFDQSDSLNASYFRPLNPNYPMTAAYSVNYPVIILTDIGVGEDMLTALRRWNPGATVSWYECEDGHASVLMPVLAQQNQWVTTFDAADWDRFSYYLYVPSSGPPERSTLGDTNQILSLIPLQY